jgi:hypothetical protein
MPLTLTTVFADLPDPRRDTTNKAHRLTDILTIATCAVIAGAESWDQSPSTGAPRKCSSAGSWNCPTTTRSTACSPN